MLEKDVMNILEAALSSGSDPRLKVYCLISFHCSIVMAYTEYFCLPDTSITKHV